MKFELKNYLMQEGVVSTARTLLEHSPFNQEEFDRAWAPQNRQPTEQSYNSSSIDPETEKALKKLDADPNYDPGTDPDFKPPELAKLSNEPKQDHTLQYAGLAAIPVGAAAIYGVRNRRR